MLRRLSRAPVSNCTRKRTNATPVCAAATGASSHGCWRSVSVMRNDYRRDWDRATADGRKMWNGIVKFTRDRIEPALPCVLVEHNQVVERCIQRSTFAMYKMEIYVSVNPDRLTGVEESAPMGE